MDKQVIKQQLDKLVEVIEAGPAESKVPMMALVNLVECLCAEISILQKTNQKQADEINRLKGEQGRPDIKGKGSDKEKNPDHSSEDERNKGVPKTRKPKTCKTQTVKANRTEIVEFGEGQLPADAEFKGYESRIFQGVKMVPDNVELQLATYYSPSQKKTYQAPLPAGYEGEFAPSVRATVVLLNHESHMTQQAIKRFLLMCGVQISSATISRMLTDGHEVFHQEKLDIMKAGLQVMPYQQLDDTSSKVNGKNHYTHILCSPFHAVYSTHPNKDRVTVLKVLLPDELKFILDKDALALMIQGGLKGVVHVNDVCYC